jgi:UDP-N-acetylglucosamine--N-acetylmuramyl-(pentapeptide) pyrophosphoryl-undecaprenol N-acetylglucosamine transferase
MKICIVTGGTGGHIYPAIALADKFMQKDPSNEIIFIGNDDRMEAQLVPSCGYVFKPLHTSGLVGSVLRKGRAVGQMLLALKKARQYLEEFQPDVAIGFGGYVSAPVILTASRMGIPTVIHEQNSIVGKANHLVMNRVSAIVTCYEKCTETFPADKVSLLGNPRATLVKEAVFDEEYFTSMGLDPDKRTILIMMGSLGSSSVNQLMKDALKGVDFGLQFLYVCGKDNLDDIHLFDDEENIHVVGYVDSMRIYGHIDGMICRAGATTLAEVTSLGIPSILIPSPYVANNHQFYNASVLVDQDAALMIEEKDLNAQSLQKAILALFANPARMEIVSNNAKKLGKPDAAYDIIELCEGLVNGGK